MSVQYGSYEMCDFASFADILSQSRPAQIEVSVAQSEVFVCLNIVNEWSFVLYGARTKLWLSRGMNGKSESALLSRVKEVT